MIYPINFSLLCQHFSAKLKFMQVNVFSNTDTCIYGTVKSVLFVGDLRSWISWVTVTHEFTSLRAFFFKSKFLNIVMFLGKPTHIIQSKDVKDKKQKLSNYFLSHLIN